MVTAAKQVSCFGGDVWTSFYDQVKQVKDNGTREHPLRIAKQLNPLESLESTGSGYAKFANKITYLLTTTRQPLS